MRGRLVAAGIAGDSVGHAGDMLEDALHAPETSARNHRDFGRLGARLLVDGRRRHVARLFGGRSSDEEGGRGEGPMRTSTGKEEPLLKDEITALLHACQW